MLQLVACRSCSSIPASASGGRGLGETNSALGENCCRRWICQGFVAADPLSWLPLQAIAIGRLIFFCVD
jgi:hypothetical protein